ncbi:MAG: aldo/keto reductase [Anaerolineales bacterium]|nr:aldo/keto reductase [Anaerolineales bacterium]
MKTYMMNNGVEIPAIGFGVFMLTPDDCERCVIEALESGYRLIDTANAYMNERAVGRAMKKSGIKREEIFLTTKIMPCDFGYEKAKQAINDTLARLDTPYIDLLLLHIRFGDYIGAWKALEDAVSEGKVKSIGISNFEEKQVIDILENGRIVPQIDQIECHPYFQERTLRKLLDKYNIRVESFYPVGHGDKKLLSEPALVALAEKYKKTVVQIILRWHTQEGFIPLPKSSNPEHIKSNLEIFDFTLTEVELENIRALDTDTSYFASHLSAITEEEHSRQYLDRPHPDYNAQK